ncbi:type II toxin-antitoxin system HicB family antitoxin [Paraburkholderia sediminicola]|uniref:type II toxin-antitoxin system HicB family antitoxin n=1 Tax=Paraburkholderia sediminicola TaxID=458836 RepID=UPI0038B6E652
MKDRVFEHKGYAGSVDFSLEDKTLHGKILFIDDLVNYEGKTLDALEIAFVEAVEFYLETCAEEGVEPDKPCSGTFNVRIPKDVHKQAQLEAARRGINLNEFVRAAIENEVNGSRSVTIHNHEHTHTHGYVESAEFEVTTSTYKEISKWKHEAEKPVKH